MKRLLKQSSVYFISTILLKAINFVLLPFYTYYMSPEILGKVFMAVVLIDGFCLLFGFSLKSSILLYVVKYKSYKKQKEIYTSVVTLTLFLFVFLLICHYSLSTYIMASLGFSSEVYNMIVISSSLGLFFPLITAYYQSKENVNRVFFLNFSFGIVSISSVLLCVINYEDKLSGYMTGHMIGVIYGFICFIFLSINLYEKPTSFFLKKTLEYSIRFFPTDIFAWVVNFSDRIMLYKMATPAANGLYTTAYKLGQSCDVIYHSVNKALTPIIYEEIRKVERNESDTKGISVVYDLSIISFITICGLLVFCSPFIVQLLSEEYQNIEIVLMLILLSYLFNAFKMVIDKPLSYYEHLVKYKSLIWFFTAIINVAFNYILIPVFGVLGAAIATFVSFFFTTIPIYILAKSVIRIKMDIIKYVTVFILWGVSAISSYIDIYLSLILVVISSIVSIKYIVIQLKLIKS